MATPYPKKYRGILSHWSRVYHIPARVAAAQQFIESGFNKDVIAGRRRSSAGAFGLTQFIPSTAKSYGVRPGTDLKSVNTQIKGQLKYLSDLGASHDLAGALAKYAGGPGNPQSWYANKVLALAPSYKGVGKGGGSFSLGPKNTPTGLRDLKLPDTSSSGGIYATLAALNQFSTVDPNDPAQANLNLLAGIEAQKPTTNPLVDLLKLGQDRGSGGKGAKGESFEGVGKLGKVHIRPGADRAGVKSRPATIRFAQEIAGVYGKPITIGTGTNHNQFVAGSRRESEHWTGHAVDIPAVGAALTRLGQSALIAAGMDPRKARKQKGGVYNIGNHQILFNTTVGGNHYNHLHASTH